MDKAGLPAFGRSGVRTDSGTDGPDFDLAGPERPNARTPEGPEIEWQSPTWAQMQAFGVRQCGWCMEYRHMSELEEIVLREPRAAKEGTGKSQTRTTAAWEGNTRNRRQCCYRCLDQGECAVASGVRGT